MSVAQGRPPGGVSPTLQAAYDGSGAPPQITVDGTNLGVTIRDSSTPIAAPLFEVQDTNGDGLFGVDPSKARGVVMAPGGRTLTTPSPAEWLTWTDTITLDYANSTIGGLVSATNTFEFNQAGSGFGAGALVKNAATFKNVNGVAASFGSQYTFVNSATYQADGAAISSLFLRNCLFQMALNRINAGTLALTTFNPGGYINPNVGAGVTITNMRHWEWAAGTYSGTVTNNDLLYMPNVTGGTNFSGIRSLINSGATRFFINHTGTAESNFAGSLNLTGAARVNHATSNALGGGGAATLGTVGGSGPTTATQATWIPVEVAGTTHWIPAWT